MSYGMIWPQPDPHIPRWSKSIGGFVQGWDTDQSNHGYGFTNPFQGAFEDFSLDQGTKDALIDTGGSVVSGWFGSRQERKAAEEAAKLQQQVAFAEIEAKRQQQAAMRNMIMILGVLGIGSLVAIKVMKKK